MNSRIFKRCLSGLICLVVFFMYAVSGFAQEATDQKTKGIELEYMRSANSKTYFNESTGVYTTEKVGGYLHYKDDKGRYQDIDRSFVHHATEKKFSVKKGVYHVELAEAYGDSEWPVEFEMRDGTIVRTRLTGIALYEKSSKRIFQLAQPKPVNGVAKDSSLWYNNVFPDVDVEYVYLANRLKQNVHVSQEARIALLDHSEANFKRNNTLLVVVTAIDLPGDVDAFAGKEKVSSKERGKTKIDFESEERVNFVNMKGDIKFYFPRDMAFGLGSNERIAAGQKVGDERELEASQPMWRRFYMVDGQLYCMTGVSLSWLDKQPSGTVVLDPSTAIPGPVWDTYICSASQVAYTNFGSDDYIRIGCDATNGKYRALIRFGLNEIPSGATIQSADMKLFYEGNSYTPSIRNISCRYLKKAFREYEVDWYQRHDGDYYWRTPGVGFEYDANETIEQTLQWGYDYFRWMTYDLTSLVNKWINDPNVVNLGVVLYAENENVPCEAKLINSSEHANFRRWPRLEVTYTLPTLGETQSDSYNYVKTYILNQANVTSESSVAALTVPSGQVAKSVAYSDRLGRSYEDISIGGTPRMNDLITYHKYNALNQNAMKYLPCAVGTNLGQFRTDIGTTLFNFYLNSSNMDHLSYRIPVSQHYFSETVYEKSPLLRTVEQGAPGVHWQPDGVDAVSGHTIRTEYRGNTTDDMVRQFLCDVETGAVTSTGYYAPSVLSVTVTTDENDVESRVFKDKNEREIMKETQISPTAKVRTYYIYDHRDNLRYIVPPEAVKTLANNGWNFSSVYNVSAGVVKVTAFQYDAYNRVVEKRIPEAEPIYTVYDRAGRVVLTQDGNLRAGGRWLFTKYDVQGRAVITGICTDTRTRTAMQSHINSLGVVHEYRSGVDYATRYGYTNNAYPSLGGTTRVLTVTYYDDYDFDRNRLNDVNYQGDTQAPYNVNSAFDRLKGKVTGVRTFIPGAERSNVFFYSGEYDSCPAAETEVYYKADQINLKPGFTSQPNQEVHIGADITLPGGYMEVGDVFTVSFYDQYGRVIQQQSENHLGGLDITDNLYDFSGKLLNTRTIHRNETSVVVEVSKRMVYDHAGRLLDVYQTNGSDPEAHIVHNQYNEIGQLIEKNLHEVPGLSGVYSQSLDYDYNIRGWLTAVNNRWLIKDNDPNDDSNDLFGMRLDYESGYSALNAPPQFNGNISAMRWRTKEWNDQDGLERGYGYDYDNLNRLTNAKYARYVSDAWDTSDRYSVSNLTYDDNGNILSLTRKGVNASNSVVTVDQLSYTYDTDRANRLVKVEDAQGCYGTDFSDGASSDVEYSYDANGNMTADANKGITDIDYDHMNLPVKVDFGGGNRIEWVYTASGNKLKRTVYTGGTVSQVTDYAGGFVYENGVLSYFGFDEGRVLNQAGTGRVFTYEYHIKDHLGNTRVVFDQDLCAGSTTGGPVQETHYYPFGLRLARLGYTTGDDNKYLYNHKELEDSHGLTWYHYGARYYDPQLGRWHVVDPVDEFYSAYVYVGNKPTIASDPDGMNELLFNEDGNYYDYIENPGGWDDITVTLDGVGTYEMHDFTNLDEDKVFSANAIIQRYKDANKKFDPKETGLSLKLLNQREVDVRASYGIVKAQAAGFISGLPGKLSQTIIQSVQYGDMDFVQNLESDFYIVGNKAYNDFDTGNLIWGRGMQMLGYPLIVSQIGAHVHNFFFDDEPYKLDTPADQNAMSAGYRRK